MLLSKVCWWWGVCRGPRRDRVEVYPWWCLQISKEQITVGCFSWFWNTVICPVSIAGKSYFSYIEEELNLLWTFYLNLGCTGRLTCIFRILKLPPRLSWFCAWKWHIAPILTYAARFSFLFLHLLESFTHTIEGRFLPLWWSYMHSPPALLDLLLHSSIFNSKEQIGYFYRWHCFLCSSLFDTSTFACSKWCHVISSMVMKCLTSILKINIIHILMH